MTGCRRSGLLRSGAAAGAMILLGAASWAVPLGESAASPTPTVQRSVTAPTSITITVPPGGAFSGFGKSRYVVAKGGTVRLANHDRFEHSVTSAAKNGNGTPLFNTAVMPSHTAVVKGVGALAPGTYHFHCRFHPGMTATLVVVGTGGGTTGSGQQFAQKLFLPPVLTGANLTIPIEQAGVRVLPNGALTQMWTYGGSYPGPTIRRPAGRPTAVKFVDKLPAKAGSFTVHLHGDHHDSVYDGRPDSYLISPNHGRTYTYPLTDGGKPERAAFDFYHDHRLGVVGRNNWRGLQGMFIIDDPVEKNLPLPKGRYDVPLLVSDRSFTATNQLTNPFANPSAPPGDATVGDHILVNGRYSPYFDVDTHRYRLRLLNGSNFQSYDFRLSDGRAFWQVGTGDGLLPQSVKRTDILLGPAQRADVVVNFAGELGKRVVLESVARGGTLPKGSVQTPTAKLLQFRVTRAVQDATSVPTAPEKAPAITASGAPTTTFRLGFDTTTKKWTIDSTTNGVTTKGNSDPMAVLATVPLGSTQVWRIVNDSPITHYFHLHEEQWHTLRRDGGPPKPWERGLEDTWKLDPGESVVVAGQFTDYTGDFMLHCHMLDHEDHGLMAQFRVTKPGVSSAATRTVADLTAMPATGDMPGMRMPAVPAHRAASVPRALPASPAAASAALPGWVVAIGGGLGGLLSIVGLAVGARRYRAWIDRMA